MPPFNKAAGLNACNFIKDSCFPANTAIFLRTTFSSLVPTYEINLFLEE